MIKILEVEWDSLEELTLAFNKVKTRYCELRRISTGTPSKNEVKRQIFDACQTIWNADISLLYGGQFDLRPNYYVYAHLDSSKRIAAGASGVTTFAATLGMTHWPFYVGKGMGSRCFELCRSETHRKVRERMRKLGRVPTVIKIREGLTEVQALQYEAKLIDIFGLITNGGLLCNLDEGHQAQRRRECYLSAYRTLCRINVPLTQVTHVDGVAATDKTRVVPASSTNVLANSASSLGG